MDIIKDPDIQAIQQKRGGDLTADEKLQLRLEELKPRIRQGVIGLPTHAYW